jgi:VWFA-related protein
LRFQPDTALLALLLLPVLAPAQEPTPAAANAGNTLSVSVQVVALTAVVHDSRGNLVRNLTRDDFLLKEDGQPQTIRYFNADNDLPLTIGLMVDTSGSQRDFADDERRASAIFLEEMITQPQDRAFVERFDSYALLLQQMTADVPKLKKSLDLLTAPIAPPKGTRGGTLLFDAICATADKVVSREPGRRALVILTDGDDNGSQQSMWAAISRAQLADVAVYSVLYTKAAKGMSNYGRTDGIEVMQQISSGTGGRAFVVTPGNTIKRIYAEIEEDLRTQYRIGYKPAPSAAGKFHTVELKAVGKGLSIQVRTGYYTPGPATVQANTSSKP